MKRWLFRIALAFIVIVCSVTVFFVIRITNDFKRSEPFRYLKSWIYENPPKEIKLLTNFETSWLIGGKLTSETAYFKFKVFSGDSSFVVYATLRKVGDSWEIVKLTYRI